MEIYEAVARVSTVACWNLFVGAVSNGVAGAFLSDAAVESIFSGREKVVIAGRSRRSARA